MSYQNINQYVYQKYRLNLIYDGQDMSLASDEKDFNQEVVFSPYLIAQTYGKKLPISFDTNNVNSVQNIPLYYKDYNFNNVLVSENFYEFDGQCFSADSVCDIGLTGIDNGLVTGMTPKLLHLQMDYYQIISNLIE